MIIDLGWILPFVVGFGWILAYAVVIVVIAVPVMGLLIRYTGWVLNKMF